MEHILLIDGNSMLFRAYYASAYGKVMTTSNNIPTNAVYGFITMLEKAIEVIKPDGVLVAWDAGKPTFRHEYYQDYKGTRKELNPDLKVQFPIVREFLDAAKITRYECVGIEADDIIGSFVQAHPQQKIHILSSDRDLLQLIRPNCDVYLMKKGISEMAIMDEAALFELYELKPKQIIDLKALMGDTADNIPGVKGVGEKGALKLLKEYETVDNLYEHVDELKGKLKEKIENGKEEAMLSKYLATIKCDAEIPVTMEDLVFNGFDDEVNDFYIKYEMKSKVKKSNSPKVEKVSGDFKVVDKVSETLLVDNAVVYAVYDNELFYESTLYGLTFAYDNKVEYINLNDLLKDEQALNYLSSDKTKQVYDAKNMYHLCAQNKLEINGINFDFMLAAFLVDQDITNVDKLVQKYQIEGYLDKDEVFGKRGKPCLVEDEMVSKHAFNFSYGLTLISDELKNKLKEYEMESLLYDMELPLSKVLYEMETRGILCNIDILDEIAQETNAKIESLNKQIYEIANHEFNVNSPKQLAIVLYDELGLPCGKKRSTAADVLEKLVHVHPIIPLLLQQRKYQKIYSTYAQGLKKHILKDGRIHTIFNQVQTQTGRLSSSDPNLQNISVKDEEGKYIRKAFVANEHEYLLSADYSQVELRMLAHMADEQTMIDAFNHDIDIHTTTAMELYEVSSDEVSAQMRRNAKTVNFGIIYGQSDFGLSEQLGISRKEAKFFIDKYFASYPNIQGYMEKTIETCQKQGYVTTLFSRRRYIKEINDKNYMMREFGKRAAMNAPIQGSAADLIKIAMLKIDAKMKEMNVKSKMILQIHDELIFEVVEDELALMKELVVKGMQEALELKVPLKVEASIGKDWYEAK